MLWLVTQKSGENSLVNSDQFQATMQRLHRLAGERAISLVEPLWDLEEQQLVSTTDILALAETPLSQATARYGAKARLSGRISATSSGAWIGQWQFYHRGEEWIERYRGGEFEAFLRAGIDLAADTLATRYAVHMSNPELRAGDNDAWVLEIYGVASPEAYTAVSGMLAEQTVLESVQLTHVSSERLQYRFHTGAAIAQLRDVLEIDDRLRLRGSDYKQLVYDWAP